MARGLLLSNPFNLEKNPHISWSGQVSPGSDAIFCQFNSDLMGIRAGYKNLVDQYKYDNLNTVSLIINKYAPSSENDTTAYINAICGALNVKPNDVLDLSKYEIIKPFGQAIIQHEQGEMPFSDRLIDQALAMLGIVSSSA